ncbi:hypothetical protein D1B33_15470 [Lysinibacillus yapensis]|uniref:Uncharacterized protein n=1 Tax=Ureibacillus yapensis TaxID=2304605 RepID=A0A396S4K0_9BACL|nr:hypothetical protein [Lysinibacillus yapensis]RHW33443.1 hypothetical protein D1B33_15470 [Lysinibacillus yapensis]
MAKEKNGKKFAIFMGIGLCAAALAVVIAILAFYNAYDPNKYGRSNGGVDTENVGIPKEAQEQREKVGSPGSSE